MAWKRTRTASFEPRGKSWKPVPWALHTLLLVVPNMVLSVICIWQADVNHDSQLTVFRFATGGYFWGATWSPEGFRLLVFRQKWFWLFLCLGQLVYYLKGTEGNTRLFNHEFTTVPDLLSTVNSDARSPLDSSRSDELESLITTHYSLQLEGAYAALHSASHRIPDCSLVWDTWAPLRVKLFLWLALRRKQWTADSRLRHGLDANEACFLWGTRNHRPLRRFLHKPSTTSSFPAASSSRYGGTFSPWSDTRKAYRTLSAAKALSL